MTFRWFSVVLSLVFGAIVLLTPLADTAIADKGENIAAWENFLRYYPHDARAERTFRAIVRAASTPEDYERNLECASLVDIDKAVYDDQTGELILIGPRIRDWGYGYLPPLLVVDDFAVAFRVLDAIGERALGVSIGTYNQGAAPGEEERDERLGRQPVEYIPEMTEGTHMGFVFFEVDRWLKNIGNGVDNHTLERLTVRIPGYQTQQERARPYYREKAKILAREGRTGQSTTPYGLNWFLPARPQVAFEGYSMKFVSYRMEVKYKAIQPDPSIAAFSEHMTNNFTEYCQQFPAFQELVRLHKLVQIAKWYRASGFPDEELLDYTPLRIPTPEHTRSMTMPVGRFDVGNYSLRASLVGGIDFTPSNEYIRAIEVPAQLLGPSALPTSQTLHVPTVYAPPQYGTYDVGAVPVPSFVAPIVQARPSADTFAWTVRIRGNILRAVAIPVTRKAGGLRSPERRRPTEEREGVPFMPMPPSFDFAPVPPAPRAD